MHAGAPSPVETAFGRLEGWLATHRRGAVASLVGAAVFVRLILCLQVAGGPLPRIHELIRDSDNCFFDEWARHLAAGDWLQRASLHPMHRWMRDVASDVVLRDPDLPVRLGLAPDTRYDRAKMEGALWDHWLGSRRYYQEPGYPYLVALTYRWLGPNVWYVFAWQLALGVASVLLVYVLARRFFSETAAGAAGLLAVLAPTPLFYEVTLLRDTLVVFTTLALALAMEWASRGGRSRWAVLGLAFGAAALVKQSFLFFPLLMGLWRFATVRASFRSRAVTGGIVVAGMIVGLLPAILRNLAVGAPVLGLNGSGTTELALFHTADALPIGYRATPAFARILAESDGHFLASLLGAARTHANAWGVVVLSLKKLLFAWHGVEMPNNVDFYVFRQGCPLLSSLPISFTALAPLAAIGLTGRRAENAWPLFVAILGSLTTMVLATVLSRYRAPLAVALMPLAGAGAIRLAALISMRRWFSLLLAGAATAVYLAWALSPPSGVPGLAPKDFARGYARIGDAALQYGEPAFAAYHFQESLRLVPGAPAVELALGKALLADHAPETALPHLAAADAVLGSAESHEIHAQALAATGRMNEAATQARAALAADPGRMEARRLLDEIEHGLTDPPGKKAIP